jgi:hypothetical protein
MWSSPNRPIRRLLAAMIAPIVMLGCGSDDAPRNATPAVPSSVDDRPDSTTRTEPPTTSTPPPESTTTSPSTSSSSTSSTVPQREDPVLRRGARGVDVRRLQTALEEVRYWVGPVDGVYGLLTEQAVQALQKAGGLEVDGLAGPAVQAALDRWTQPVPRSRTGLVWEVDKGRQLLLLVRDGRLEWTFHTSTGTEQPYTFQGRRLLADTPEGRFEIEWDVNGLRDGALGRLYRPKYFHPDGIAIHGYGSVPATAASHGCVRVTIDAMDFIWREELAPLGATVWVYGDARRDGDAPAARRR